MLHNQTARFRDNIVVSIHDHNQQFWLTAEDVGRCLGYGPGNERKGISALYNRHMEDSTIVNLTTVDEKQRDVRVFSKTGCIKLGFFAATRTAKEFRTWAARTLAGGSPEYGQLAALQQAYLNSCPEAAKMLRYREMGLSQREIGRLLGCSADTARARLKKLAALGLSDYRPSETMAARGRLGMAAMRQKQVFLAAQQTLALEGVQ